MNMTMKTNMMKKKHTKTKTKKIKKVMRTGTMTKMDIMKGINMRIKTTTMMIMMNMIEECSVMLNIF